MLDLQSILFNEYNMEMNWQRILAETSQPEWFGDLNDDCSANWAGLTLRAEEMDENYWWWCVYDNELPSDLNQVRSSNDDGATKCISGAEAREAAANAG
jgi:hypothetical protein